MHYLFLFGFICSSAFAQYVDKDVWAVRCESFMNLRRMITKKERVSADTHNIRLAIKRGRDLESCYGEFLDKEKQRVYKKIGDKFDVNLSEKTLKGVGRFSTAQAVGCSPQKRKALEAKYPAPSEGLLQRARKTFGYFIDKPDSVPVVAGEKDYSAAAANDMGIYICEKGMNAYDDEGQSYLFAHELIHYIEKHSGEERLIRELLKEKHGTLTRTMYRYLNELGRCNEAIADVKGALKGGRAFLEGYKKFAITCLNDVKSDTHLPAKKRLMEAELLLKELSMIEWAKEL